VRKVAFHSDAFEQFTEWGKLDGRIFERLTRLIKETARDPFAGIGKHERQRHHDSHHLVEVYLVWAFEPIIRECPAVF
jgi:Txe/YoeB family toxin of Txe-Axe toxin-antitoxin module